ncbi:MAG: hypothetical protein ABI277_05775 [Burkholderiaceae bacterium]
MPANVGLWLGAFASVVELMVTLVMPTTAVEADAGEPLLSPLSLPPQLASDADNAIAVTDSKAVAFTLSMLVSSYSRLHRAARDDRPDGRSDRRSFTFLRFPSG